MKPLGRNFWIGVFGGFVLFVVALLGVILVHSWTTDKMMNREREAELLSLQEFPPSNVLSVYEDTGNWSLLTLDRHEVIFKDFKGKIVFVNFWATWCGPCIQEMPSIQRLYDSLQALGVEFLLISDEPMDTLSIYAADNQFTVPLYHTSGNIPAALPVAVLPTTYILNKEGMIMFKHIGGGQWDHPWAISFLRQMLK